MTEFAPDFYEYDAEALAEHHFKNGDRLTDLHDDPSFIDLLERAEKAGVEGRIYEVVGEVSRKYSKIVYNPECL